MSLLSFDQLLNATQRFWRVTCAPTFTDNSAPGNPVSSHIVNGGGSAGDASSGIVPTSASTGFQAFSPTANAASSDRAYIAGAEIQSYQCANRAMVCDCVYMAGQFSAASITSFSLTSQPSYAARLPARPDAPSSPHYGGLCLFVEGVGGTGAASNIRVGYTNQNGVSGKVTPQFTHNCYEYRMTQAPLAAGDSGVQKVDTVYVDSAAVGGLFNVMVLRPLFWFWEASIWAHNGADLSDCMFRVVSMEELGLPVVSLDAAVMIAHHDGAASVSYSATAANLLVRVG
jgi:hypothetical protein